MPDRMLSCGARGQSVSALQSLTLLNSPFLNEQSRLCATRLLQSEPIPQKRINRLFLRTLGRLPSERENQTTLRFLHAQERILSAKKEPNLQQTLWADLCLALFNLNDFLWIR